MFHYDTIYIFIIQIYIAKHGRRKGVIKGIHNEIENSVRVIGFKHVQLKL